MTFAMYALFAVVIALAFWAGHRWAMHQIAVVISQVFTVEEIREIRRRISER